MSNEGGPIRVTRDLEMDAFGYFKKGAHDISGIWMSDEKLESLLWQTLDGAMFDLTDAAEIENYLKGIVQQLKTEMGEK